MLPKSPASARAKANQRRGKIFEQRCAELANEHGVETRVVIRKSYGESAYDLVFKDYPSYALDCKYTTGHFTLVDLENKLKKCITRYCTVKDDAGNPTEIRNGKQAIIIFGERKGKTKVSDQNLGVALESSVGMVVMPFLQWLRALVQQEETI